MVMCPPCHPHKWTQDNSTSKVSPCHSWSIWRPLTPLLPIIMDKLHSLQRGWKVISFIPLKPLLFLAFWKYPFTHSFLVMPWGSSPFLGWIIFIYVQSFSNFSGPLTNSFSLLLFSFSSMTQILSSLLCSLWLLWHWHSICSLSPPMPIDQRLFFLL